MLLQAQRILFRKAQPLNLDQTIKQPKAFGAHQNNMHCAIQEQNPVMIEEPSERKGASARGTT